MTENVVAIRCSSELNTWMDGIMVVPQEMSEKIAARLRERFAGLWELEKGFGDIIREVAEEFNEMYVLCWYDEATDEPTEAWETYCNRLHRIMPVIEIDV